jgi:peptidoglycan/xylan/chitin deacetylase (PgdA/CDA1 family)
VRDFEPDLGISLAAPILKRALFELPRLGTLNLHKGKLPEFRGMPPAFWELWTDQTAVGCSVHMVDDRLDTGALLVQAQIERAPYSSLKGLQLQLDEVGVDLVCRAVEEMLGGFAEPTPQAATKNKTYRKPTLAQQATLEARLSNLEAQPSRWKRLLKNGYCHMAFVWHRMIAWKFVAPRATVLLYHRVSDDVRDNLTVGIAQFERQLALLNERCDVVSIEQILAMEEFPRQRRPIVAVTFDDGYQDNYAHAAAILRRHRVPASFYVSTGIIGTQKQFPHDERRGNAPIPVMTWEQLRRMRTWGFSVGSHTASHIDCVAETEQCVRTELAQSKSDLIRELGPLEPVFAYPYGGRHQMNNERLALVRAAGFVACLSAYGGSNIRRLDRWNVMRRGINWEFSDAAFLYQCLGR